MSTKPTDTTEIVKQAVHAALNERTDLKVHNLHHEWINEQIAEQHRKREQREKIKTHVIGWGVITAISGFGYAIWEVGKKVLGK